MRVLRAFGLVTLSACALAPAACSAHRAPGSSGTAKASAPLQARSGSSVHGTATFQARDGGVEMRLTVTGATPGPHAVHLHEKGDCSDPEAKSAGAHWNPTNAPHGNPSTPPCHRGDIGNLEVDAKGEGTLVYRSSTWTIGGDPATDVIGKAVIVHAQVDDFTSQPAGNAGARVACGVVAR